MGIQEDRKSLEMVYAALEALIDISPAMPLQQAATIILVALNEGTSLKELVQKTGVKQSTMSRHLIDLGKRNRRMEQGYQIVDCRQDDFDMRKNQYVLSIKGRAVIDKVVKAVRKYADIR